METPDQSPKLNPWNPITDPVTLKHIGKLQEELGELQAALARCLIQGVHECEPVTGKPNYIWLEEEIADVKAGIFLLEKHLNLNLKFIDSRTVIKMSRLAEWHKMAGKAI